MNSKKFKRCKSFMFFVIITLMTTATINSLPDISAGGYHNLAIDDSGNLWAWGQNWYGQLGDGTSGKKNNKISPIQIKEGTKWRAIAAAGFSSHSLAIDDSGNLWAWGANGDGQIGDGTKTMIKSSPVKIKEGTIFKGISARSHSLAIDENDHLWAWGGNNIGQLGDNSTVPKLTPVRVNFFILPVVFIPVIDTSVTVKVVAAGGEHSLAIDNNGNLWGWGRNGEEGIAATFNSYPLKIKDGTKFTAIAAGHYHSLAIDDSGNLWAWGNNTFGQVGDTNYIKAWEGRVGTAYPIVQIKTGTRFTAVAAGSYHSLAIDDSGNLWTWGNNSDGQLGDGTFGFKNNKKSPVQIKAGTTFVSVSAGEYHSLAVDKDGNIWTWGRNGSGQLGDGTFGKGTNKSSPVQIYLK